MVNKKKAQPENPIRKAVDDTLDVLNDQTVELSGRMVARVFTVAAMSNWTPAVEDPFESIQGAVTVNLRIIAEAYMVAILAGWQPEKGDPVVVKLQELGYLTWENGSVATDGERQVARDAGKGRKTT